MRMLAFVFVLIRKGRAPQYIDQLYKLLVDHFGVDQVKRQKFALRCNRALTTFERDGASGVKLEIWTLSKEPNLFEMFARDVLKGVSLVNIVLASHGKVFILNTF